MKILITADFHYREQWFRLLSRAPEWDLVCIAGHLLDMFNAEPRIVQARDRQPMDSRAGQGNPSRHLFREP